MARDLWAMWADRVHQLGFSDATQMAWVLALSGVALLGLWVRWRLRQASSQDEFTYAPEDDQFALTAPINQTHIQVLHYLNRAFPEGMVLFRPALARFVSVRKSHQREHARRYLYKTAVDFLVCDEEGLPLVAFEVDAFRDVADPDTLRRLSDKTKLLMSAGIRLIRLKGHWDNFLSPAELRARLYASQKLARTRGLGTASTFNRAGAAPSSFGQTELLSTFADEVRASKDARQRAVPVSDRSAWQLVGKRS
ncbi:DUF2726 domain-containing protein [Ottowia sp.]|uniref:DUF2726 domain-containing protein n=1 Tax=Ottowia sp. TaxID=1898956 RepID=UPI003A83BA06